MNVRKYGLMIFGLISTAANSVEKRVEMQFAALPESVQYTVSHYIDPKNITRIEKIIDSDYVRFEVVSTKTVNNKDFVDTDMTVAADGEIMTLKKEAPMFAIPYPVMQRVNRQYPNLKIDEVEIVQTRHFLLTGKVDGQRVNLKVFDDGAVEQIPIAVEQTQPQKTPPSKTNNEPVQPITEEPQTPSPMSDDELPIFDDSEDSTMPPLGD